MPYDFQTNIIELNTTIKPTTFYIYSYEKIKKRE